MSTKLDDNLRAVFAGIADFLIPEALGMPSASQVDVHGELADRILTAVGRGEGINECYDSLTGFGTGHPEFMWSSAGVLMMADGFYRRPPVVELAAVS